MIIPNPEQTNVDADSTMVQTPVIMDVKGSKEDTSKAHKIKDFFTAAYIPDFGFKIAEGKLGMMRIKIMTYVRYLNSKLLEPTHVNLNGDTLNVLRRQDVQLNKVNIALRGWLFTEKFSYWVFVWTNNAANGQPFYMAVAGSLDYKFNKYIGLGGGLNAYNATRSTEGQFPYWLTVDNRLLADEFFRASYSSGFWATGQLSPKTRYHLMIGNNMSTLGIDATQMDNLFRTFAADMAYFPTTGEYGLLNSNFGDFENHEKPAVRLAWHYLRSLETRQGQPKTDALENVQVRLSEGTPLFAPNVFAEGTQVDNAVNQMADFDTGVKYKGFEVAGEYYLRWIKKFNGRGMDSLNLGTIFDHGFQLQVSAMALPKTLQFYAGTSFIFGKYSTPWECRAGFNYFPFKQHAVRLNMEYIYTKGSPVGGTSVPYSVGGTGGIFDFNLIVNI